VKPVEFRSQVFRNSAQWAYGLGDRLQNVAGGGIALFSRPGFAGWAIQSTEARHVESMAVDRCGSIFWISGDCELYRHNPINNQSERMTQLAECDKRNKHRFGRMLIAKGRIWILDREGSRVIALRTDTLQIINEISLRGPIDIAWGLDRLIVLDQNGISSYDECDNTVNPPRREHLCRPRAIGIDPQRKWIYVVDNTAEGIARFKLDGSFHDEIGRFSQVSTGFTPAMMAVSQAGNLFLSDGSPLVHEFSADGGYVGDTGDMNPLTGISAIAFGPGDDLYVASPAGIARFNSSVGLAGNQGEFYSGTLDSGCDGDDCWHRVDLVANLGNGGALDVRYATTDEPEIVEAARNIFQQNSAAFEKIDALEMLLRDLWKGPDELRELSAVESAAADVGQGSFLERPSHSVLFRSQTKRYLWLKLTLSGVSAGANAAVSSMRVYYPRLSYLRYLPAVYQEDAASREFLEHFLSLFETVFGDLETTLARIPDVFDPQQTPKDFLDWLAQWLDLGIEEEWAPEVKRRLISQASFLYQKKGRPDGLADFIEIVTGRRPAIQESFEIEQPLILGAGRHLGRDTRVFRRPMVDLPRDQRTVLGSSSFLGQSRIRNITQVPADPFQAAAHHFTVLLDLTPQEFRRYERSLHRIIRENAPAHVGYDIRLVSNAGLGPDLILGVNFRVEDPQPLRLGDSPLGRSILSRLRYGPEIGIDATVTGSSCGSNDATFSYGEQ